jgi:hypothetical protein
VLRSGIIGDASKYINLREILHFTVQAKGPESKPDPHHLLPKLEQKPGPHQHDAAPQHWILHTLILRNILVALSFRSLHAAKLGKNSNDPNFHCNFIYFFHKIFTVTDVFLVIQISL